MTKITKALSIRQPWAWLIVNGHKDIENRDWRTNYRGPFAVHASKTFDKEGYEYVQNHFPEIKMPCANEFEKGGIVGTAKVMDCVNDHESQWFIGDYGFVLAGAKTCDFIPMKGALNFFPVELWEPTP